MAKKQSLKNLEYEGTTNDDIHDFVLRWEKDIGFIVDYFVKDIEDPDDAYVESVELDAEELEEAKIEAAQYTANTNINNI